MQAIRKVEARLFDKEDGRQLANMLRMLMKAQAEVDDEKIERKRAKITTSHYM